MDTLGSLVDKLSITNIKIWFVQDKVYKAAKESVDLEAKYVQDLASLNLLRNQLMVEIDKTLANAVCDGVVLMDPRVKIT
jgi:hypothetical protein